MEVQHTFYRKSGDLSKKLEFFDDKPEVIANVLPEKSYAFEYVFKKSLTRKVQSSPQYAVHEVNTDSVTVENRGMDHKEGGWPKDINPTDLEQTVRFKKKIEKDDMYIHSVHQLSHTVEQCILQNNAIDIYEMYFENEDFVPVSENATVRTLTVFRDPCSVKRAIRHLSWSPDGGSRLAVSYYLTDSSYNISDRISTHSYIWHVENPNVPESTLHSPVAIATLEYNPKELHSLLSGLQNGQVCIWDIRKGTTPVETSAMEYSHREAALHTLWINSKSGTEFFSSSPDGQLMWWDTRKLSQPSETLIIDTTKGEAQSLARAYGVSSLEYEASIPVRFMVGTETGLVISGNRKGKTPNEKLTGQYRAYHGPVYSLQRNSSFVKIFLTIGDWNAKIWSEDCRESAIIWTSYYLTTVKNNKVRDIISHQKSRLTSGAWSPTRYSVFHSTALDGTLNTWDILKQQKKPMISVKVCDDPLKCVKCHEGGMLVAVGNNKGNTYMLEFSETMATSAKNDKALLTAIFERENRREKIIESKMKEIRLKSKVGKVIDTQMAIKDAKSVIGLPLDQSYTQQAEMDFFKITQQNNGCSEEVK